MFSLSRSLNETKPSSVVLLHYGIIDQGWFSFLFGSITGALRLLGCDRICWGGVIGASLVYRYFCIFSPEICWSFVVSSG